jgi:cyclin-dependent kinase 7
MYHLGTQLSTKKTVAIKKIKIGQFKDGLDMSAIREVKTLQELRHPNIIEVSSSSEKQLTCWYCV